MKSLLFCLLVSVLILSAADAPQEDDLNEFLRLLTQTPVMPPLPKEMITHCIAEEAIKKLYVDVNAPRTPTPNSPLMSGRIGVRHVAESPKAPRHSWSNISIPKDKS